MNKIHGNKGKKFTKEHRANISSSRMGIKLSARHRANISAGLLKLETNGPKPLSNREWQKKLDIRYGKNVYKIINSIDGRNKEIQHSCGLIFIVDIYKLTRKYSPKKCKCEYIKTGTKLRSNKDWQIQLDSRYGKEEYSILKSFSNRHKLILHSCGLNFEVKDIGGLLRTNPYTRCPCLNHKRSKLTKEIHNRDILKWRGPDFECLEFDAKDLCTYIHHPCGHTWQTTCNSFKLSKHCPQCNAEVKRKEKQREIRNKIKDLYSNDYKVLEYLENERGHLDRIKVRHNCGHEYIVTYRLLTYRGTGKCPECFGYGIGSPKEVEVDGKSYRCMGFEPYTLKKILRKWPDIDVITSLDPRQKEIRYNFEGKRKYYKPDFYIPSKKIIIEVKSLATAGLIHPRYEFFLASSFERLQAKARQCTRLGYKFILHLYNGRKNGKLQLLSMPNNWKYMTKEKVAYYLNVKIADDV